MGRKGTFQVKETLSELKNKRSEISNYKSSQKLQALILMKTNPEQFQSSIAEQLTISSRTLSRWINAYKKDGLKLYLAAERRNKASKIISPEVHRALEKRLKQPNDPFSGYVEVQQWLKDHFDVDIEYQWLWKYMRTKLGSVLKVPRKSHAKKDPEAGEAFFKNAGDTGTY